MRPNAAAAAVYLIAVTTVCETAYRNHGDDEAEYDDHRLNDIDETYNNDKTSTTEPSVQSDDG